MNKSFVKFVTDFGPLAIFLYIYYSSGKDLKAALVPFIISTLIALVIVWFFEKRIPMVPLFGGLLITFFGGLTIYVKPTIINILFGLALLFGKYFTTEPILKKILGNALNLNEEGWKIMTNRWMYFFFLLALLNEVVWRTQSEEFWVNFKVWGLLPITFIFTAFQVGLINKYKINE